MVRFPGDGERRGGVENKARIFVWPADASIIMVDAVSVLADIDATKFDGTNNLDIRPRAGAAATLRNLAAKRRIVYLAPEATRPLSYNKLSAWLERAAIIQDRFPDGPVLAPVGTTAETAADRFAHDASADLKSRFKGAHVAIAGSVQHARQFQEAGLQTYLLSEAKEVPEGMTAVKSWKELATRLAK